MNETIDIKQLRRKNTVTPKAQPWRELLNKDITLFGSGLPDKVRESFALGLGSLLEAGVDIRTALELVVAEHKKKKHKAVFTNILQQVTTGHSLSSAMKKRPEFSAYEYYSIQIGEETGKLHEVLHELAKFYNKKIKQRRQIIGALTYPALVLCVAGGAIFFMVSYVVPMFSDILKRSGDDLPAITKAVISFSTFARQWMPIIFLIFAAAALLAFRYRKTSWLRATAAAAILKMPVWGSLVQKIYTARFAHTMAMLMNARIPMLQAIRLAKQIISFYPYEVALEQTEQSITHGAPLHKALSQHKIFPAKITAMVKVGEEVNQLETFFTRLADQYSNEIEYQATMLSKVIEPLIIVVLGLVVGVILVAMYLPLFKLGQQF